jgi:hypothetical protein
MEQGFPTYEEPEGLTIWAVEDSMPGYGILHALLIDNDEGFSDDVDLKHYTNTITIDASYSGTGNGRPEAPFTTIAEAQKRINCFYWKNCPAYCPWNSYQLPDPSVLPEGVWCRWGDSEIECFITICNEEGCYDLPWTPNFTACGLCEHSWQVSNLDECYSWEGARFKIHDGTYPESYPESILFDNHMQLFADGGTAHIRSRLALSSPGAINIGSNGGMIIY